MKAFFLVFSFFTLLSLLITWPLIFHLNTFIIDPFDGLLITWFLNWNIHSILGGFHGWANLFNGNIFYPYTKTLAFSEIMLPQAILALPLVILFKEPLLAYNFNFLLGFTLTGTSLFYLMRALKSGTRVSILIATLFTFSTIHLNYMAHLQLFNIWPLILTVLFLIRNNYKLFILMFVVSVLTGILFLYFLLFTVFILLVFLRKDVKKVVLATSISLIFLLPFLLQYYFVSKEFNYTRPINDAIHFSLQFPDLANISNLNQISTLIGPIAKTTPAFPGVTFSILIISLGFFLYQQRKVHNFFNFNNNSSKMLLSFLALAIISFILSLGPALHLSADTVRIGPFPAIPLPYIIFYYLVPGFAGFRTPSRWILLTFLALAIAIGLTLHKKISNKLTVLVVILVLLEIRFPFAYTAVPPIAQFPPEQVWLANNYPSAPIIQFPIYNWDNPTPARQIQGDRPEVSVTGFGQETLREYYSTIHFHPMFNGFSGFSPKEWENKVREMQKYFPSNSTINYLKSIKIDLVVAPQSWENKMSKFSQLRLVKRFPETHIYEIL